MPNLTLTQMRAQIAVLIPDASIANTDIDSAIQTVHQVFPGDFFIAHTSEALTLATDTWEYALPETLSVSSFVTIREIWLESSTAGLFTEVIPDHLWRVNYDGSGVWELQLDRRFSPIAGRKLRIIGQRKYTIPSLDADVIELHNGWVMQYALGLLHASRGGTSSDLAAWHRQMAMMHFGVAEQIANNINNRALPGTTLVPGVF